MVKKKSVKEQREVKKVVVLDCTMAELRYKIERSMLRDILEVAEEKEVEAGD